MFHITITLDATPALRSALRSVLAPREARALKAHVESLFKEQAAKLDQIGRNLVKESGTIMATLQETTERLKKLDATLDKISGETTGLVVQVRSLKKAVEDAKAEGVQIPDEVMQALDALSAKADSVDAQVDDVAPNPTPTPEAGAGEDIGKVGGI